MIRILIGGDVCPVNRSQALLAAGDAEAVFSDLLPEFRRADLGVVNLECPLIEQPSPIAKVGPVLGAPTECARGLREAGIHLVGLANNHILDQGSQGLDTTLSALHRYGLEWVGAGRNIEQSSRLSVHPVGGLRVGVLAVAEHEFSTATQSRPGANPLDVVQLVRALRLARGNCDFLTVLLHGGNEFYPYPSPRLQSLCRFLAEEGAGAIVCQHSHCPGCIEQHHGAHIVYGQGNLAFDQHPHPLDSWYEGFLVVIEIGDDGQTSLHSVPYRQFDSTASVRRLDGVELSAFNDGLAERSANVLDEAFVGREWARFCRSNADAYFSYLSGHSRLLRYINARLPFTRCLYPERRKLLVRSVVQCESHREVLETVLSSHE